eukprot:8740247-Pyramimonas_sp.AAC.1
MPPACGASLPPRWPPGSTYTHTHTRPTALASRTVDVVPLVVAGPAGAERAARPAREGPQGAREEPDGAEPR